MGKLNILHHKSYHPYKRENIERVRRDEEAARLAEEAEDGRRTLADSEARISALREQSRLDKKGRGRKEEKEAERRLDRQLAGKSAPEGEDDLVPVVSFENKGNDGGLYDKDGHINFWAGADGPDASLVLGKVKEKEKKTAQQEWEEKHTMYLGKPGDSSKTPWYQSQDLLSSEERSKGDDIKLEEAYKDTQRKVAEDPMSLMSAYLERREAVKAHKTVESNTSRYSHRLETPREFYEPVESKVKRLGDKRRHEFWNERDREREQRRKEKEEEKRHSDMTDKANGATGSGNIDRNKELERVKALKERERKKKQGSETSAASTPRSEWGYETGMYNYSERRAAALRERRERRW